MTEDIFQIDSHKLIFHVQRVARWLEGGRIFPLYMEIAPSGGCNHRCIFCALDYLKYRSRFLDKDVLRKTVDQAASLGVKSIMYAGEGEPLLHQDIAEIISFTKASGIDAAITTNGVLLSRELAGKILRLLSWIRISLNAGRSSTYAKVHRAGVEDFGKVLSNLEGAVAIKNKGRLPVSIGVQLLLIPENSGEVFRLAGLLKEIGVDYLTVKPYSQHPLSQSRLQASFDYSKYLGLGKRLEQLQSKDFRVFFREVTMKRLEGDRDYSHCYGLPFWAYIDACGDVYGCSAFLSKQEFCYGNIYTESFRRIISGRRRDQIVKNAALRLDAGKCRKVCRLDKINSYLWELKHPRPHVNFI